MLKKLSVLTAVCQVLSLGACSSPEDARLKAGKQCSVAYKVENEWPDGATVQVRFVGPDRLDKWVIEWHLGEGESIQRQDRDFNVWNARVSVDGNTVTANQDENWHWNPGASGSFGFNLTKPKDRKAHNPAEFRLNGLICNSEDPEPKPTPTPSPNPQPTSNPNPKPGQNYKSPLERHGKLKLCGTKICDQSGSVVQLRGISTHGLQWFGKSGTDGKCLNDDAMRAMAGVWKADFIRIALYVAENGYNDRPYLKDEVKWLIRTANDLGMYVLLDWHILSPGNPNDPQYYKADAFFSEISAEFRNNINIIYEIANEPNGVSWSEIKRYAERVIPRIRANDPAALIVVGSPDYSSFNWGNGDSVKEILADPPKDKTGKPLNNLMYALHFYAEDHDSYQNIVKSYANKIPLFVSEWGVGNYRGEGSADKDASRVWLDLMNEHQVSWAVWNWGDKYEATSLFSEGACDHRPWNVDSKNFAQSSYLKASGKMIFQALTQKNHDFSRLK